MGHAFGEDDDGEVVRQGVDDAFDPFQRHAVVVGRGAEGSGGVEYLEGVDACLDFHAKEVNDGTGDFFHEFFKGGGFGVVEGFECAEVFEGAAFGHVGGQCPGGASESEQGFVQVDFLAGHTQGGGEVGEFFLDAGWVEGIDFFLGVEKVVHGDTAAGGFVFEVIRLTEGFGDDEDV